MNENSNIESRLVLLEQAMLTLQSENSRRESPIENASEEDAFWALEGLTTRSPEGGAVLYVGTVELPTGGAVQWQYGIGAEDLFAKDWSEQADALAALGHPIRLQILQAVLNGKTTVAQLVEQLDAGTSGQIYHHLKELLSSRWLTSLRRGTYEVPPARIVPLMAILTAVGTPI
jgi:DNA-binding transcriptional ArsR family regulator